MRVSIVIGKHDMHVLRLYIQMKSLIHDNDIVLIIMISFFFCFGDTYHSNFIIVRLT